MTMISTPPPSTPAAANYRYAGEYSVSRQSSVEGTVPITTPSLGPNGMHSLAEVAVQNYNQNSTVEAGWIVQPGSGPELFSSWWRSNQLMGYKEFGAVSNGRGTFTVTQENGAWVASYNGRVLVRWPDSNWGPTNFRHASVEQVFAEAQGDNSTELTHGTFDTNLKNPITVFGAVTSHGPGWFRT